jgi:hypothetical protein
MTDKDLQQVTTGVSYIRQAFDFREGIASFNRPSDRVPYVELGPLRHYQIRPKPSMKWPPA